MAVLYEFNCPVCSFMEIASGRPDALFSGPTVTVLCLDEQRLYDVKADEIVCPKDPAHRLELWTHPGPCPKCGHHDLAKCTSPAMFVDWGRRRWRSTLEDGWSQSMEPSEELPRKKLADMTDEEIWEVLGSPQPEGAVGSMVASRWFETVWNTFSSTAGWSREKEKAMENRPAYTLTLIRLDAPERALGSVEVDGERVNWNSPVPAVQRALAAAFAEGTTLRVLMGCGDEDFPPDDDRYPDAIACCLPQGYYIRELLPEHYMKPPSDALSPAPPPLL
jgi:hypothetical protein